MKLILFALLPATLHAVGLPFLRTIDSGYDMLSSFEKLSHFVSIIDFKHVFVLDMYRPSWTYNKGEKDGPEKWGGLSDAWKACGAGKAVSLDASLHVAIKMKFL